MTLTRGPMCMKLRVKANQHMLRTGKFEIMLLQFAAYQEHGIRLIADSKLLTQGSRLTPKYKAQHSL